MGFMLDVGSMAISCIVEIVGLLGSLGRGGGYSVDRRVAKNVAADLRLEGLLEEVKVVSVEC